MHIDLRITYEKTNSQDLLGPLLGKQNIQGKEVYCEPKKLSHSWCGTTTFVPVVMPSIVSVDHRQLLHLKNRSPLANNILCRSVFFFNFFIFLTNGD